MSAGGSIPPTELQGPLGQVMDPGGGVTPLLTPTPLPNAIANASPGVGTGSLVPSPAPRFAADDPSSLATVMSQMANEMFGGGANVSPVSGAMPPGSFAAMSTPASPGITQPSPDFMRIPMFESAVPGEVDAAPYFMPDANIVGLDNRALNFDGVDHSFAAGDETPAVRDLGGNSFDPHVVRRDFPILQERVHGKPLVWLDNGATTQKPQAVIDRLSYFYEHENSNIHRSAHTLAARASDAYDGARETTRRFLNAPSVNNIIFVRGATEGINLIAQSWGRRNISAGDEIVITWLEHHANIVPWQQLCAERGAKLRVAPVDDNGDILLDEYERLLSPRTKLVSLTQVSNALGTVTPAREMVAMAHRHGACVVVDGAQAVSHMRVDVQALDCDFYVFSGHKVFAPTGIGAVYGKSSVLEAMPPWQGGGNMIQDVTFERTTYQGPPARFEAGTGNIADAAGLGAALDYVMRIGQEVIETYEHDLLVYALTQLATVPTLRMIGAPKNRAGVLSFVLQGRKTEEVGGALDKEGIAVRSGHHCAQPILRRLGVEASVRASLAFYNTSEDIDAMVAALKHIVGSAVR